MSNLDSSYEGWSSIWASRVVSQVELWFPATPDSITFQDSKLPLDLLLLILHNHSLLQQPPICLVCKKFLRLYVTTKLTDMKSQNQYSALHVFALEDRLKGLDKVLVKERELPFQLMRWYPVILRLFNACMLGDVTEGAVIFSAENGLSHALELLLSLGFSANTSCDRGTVLLLATKHNFYKTAQVLIQHNALVDVPTMEGKTPLFEAVRNGERLTKLLLDAKADVNTYCASDNTTPLCYVNFVPLLDLLSKRATKDNLSLALHWALQKSEKLIIQRLLTKGAQFSKEALNIAVDKKKKDLLLLCLKSGQFKPDHISQTLNYMANNNFVKNVSKEVFMDLANLLLSERADIRKADLLSVALGYKDLDLLKQWLIRGASLEKRHIFSAVEQVLDVGFVETIGNTNPSLFQSTKEDQTLLHAVATTSYYDNVVRYLIHKRCNVNAKDNLGRTPLHLSAANNRVGNARIFLNYNCNIEVQDKEDDTPLHYAVRSESNHDMVSFLVDSNASVDIQNKKGDTPIHIASTKKCPILLETLISATEDTDITNNEGKTALHLAIEHQREQAALLLIQANSDVSTLDNQGQSALLKAVMGHCSLSVVEALLEEGADVYAIDEKGNSPLRSALECFRPLLMRYTRPVPLCFSSHHQSPISDTSAQRRPPVQPSPSPKPSPLPREVPSPHSRSQRFPKQQTTSLRSGTTNNRASQSSTHRTEYTPKGKRETKHNKTLMRNETEN